MRDLELVRICAARLHLPCDLDALRGLVDYEAEILRWLLRAIRNWREITEGECNAQMQQPCSEEEYEKLHDDMADKAALACETERAMFATLGVSIFSSVEGFVGAVCEGRGSPFVDGKGKTVTRANWDHKKRALQCGLAVNTELLPGFDRVTRVRILSNCFKHNGGKANEEFVKKYGQPKHKINLSSDHIEYENEAWEDLITGCKSLLLAAVEKLCEP